MDDVRRFFMADHQIFGAMGRTQIAVISALLWKQNALCKIRQMSYNKAAQAKRGK